MNLHIGQSGGGDHLVPLTLLLGFFFKRKSRSHPNETEAIWGVGP